MTATARRRWLGVAALGGAVALLVLGQTLLRGSLSPLLMLFYWTLCLMLTAVAVIIALVDARATAQKTLQERRNLFDATLKDIQAESVKRRARNGKGALPNT